MSNHPISEVHTETEYDKLAAAITDITFAMLTTVSSDGTLRSRPLTTQKPEKGQTANGTLWFFTGMRTEVVSEIEHSPEVNVSYSNPDDSRYVSVSGTAEVSRDRRMMSEMWNDIYKAWFPAGLEDPDICLLKITISSAEYWEPPSGKMIQLLGIIKAAATGQRAEPGGHQVLEFPADRGGLKSKTKSTNG